MCSGMTIICYKTRRQSHGLSIKLTAGTARGAHPSTETNMTLSGRRLPHAAPVRVQSYDTIAAMEEILLGEVVGGSLLSGVSAPRRAEVTGWPRRV